MATKTNHTHPKTTPRPRGERDHQEPAGPRQPTDLIRLASLCLTGLLAGVNDITYLSLAGAASLERSLLSSACTALPFTVACILAAAFLDPLVRCTRLPPSSSFILASSLIAGTHASTLALPSSWSETVPCAVLRHLLLGVGNTLSLTIATLLCRGGTTTTLGVLHGTVALGVVLRTALTIIDTRGGVFAVSEGKGQHLAALGLALVTAGFHVVLAGSPPTAGSPGSEPAEKGKEVRRTIWDDAETAAITGDRKIWPSPDVSKSDGYSPPASRTTILIALFAFVHHGAVAAIPAGLVSSSFEGRMDTVGHLSSTTYTTAAFWTGITLGRLMIPSPPWGQQYTCIRLKQAIIVRAVLVAASCSLLLFWFSWSMLGHVSIPAAGLFGIVLGPMYPWAVSVLMREMDEDEALSGVGIVVAFGYAGEMFALLTVQLVTHLAVPVVLYAVTAGLVGGMLVCWRVLVEDEDGEAGCEC